MIPHNKPSLGPEEQRAAQRVLESGFVGPGDEVRRFEDEVCEFLELPAGHAVALSSGSAALFLALRILGAAGREVVFPAHVCSSLRHATALAGAQEHLVDCAEATPNLDRAAVEARGADFAFVPYMYGIPCELPRCTHVIEDCAQSIGGAWNGTKLGCRADVGVLSFYATKLLTSGGTGGMLVSRQHALADAARDFREFDQRRDRERRFNFQMNDLQAGVGRAQLARLPQMLERRAQIFDAYRGAGLDLLDATDARAEAVRYRAVLRTENPQGTIAALEAAGVRAIQPLETWELLGDPEHYPRARRWTETTASLPCYPALTDEQVAHVIASVPR